MSVIIDANVTSSAFSKPPAADFRPILDAIARGKASLVLGGTKMRAEYWRNDLARKAYVAFLKAGRAISVNDDTVDAEEKLLEARNDLKSDDPHILALARISGARLLCSLDQALHEDFGNAALISNPRGYVYQRAEHSALIRKCCIK